MTRVALITGGASGLGLAAAQRLAEDGLAVAIADVDEVAARKAAATLPAGRHLATAVDVSDERSVVAMLDEVEGAMGPVAVLACFAGIHSLNHGTGRVALATTSLNEWNRVFAVNAAGTFLCMREMLLRRSSQPVTHGRIITVSSFAGQTGGIKGGPAYAASKGAILALTKSAAIDACALGVTVNCVAPGPIDTPLVRQSVEDLEGFGQQVPVGRIGYPEEVAAAVSFLASHGAAFITGATIDVNGGLLMR